MSRRPMFLAGLLAALLPLALVFSGCEPQFTDHVCESDLDCFPDERCVVQRCRPAPDTGPDVELNECGGTEVLEHSVGDPCGPCDLDQWECSGTELVCDGETACPELDLITTIPTSITPTTATLNGRIQEFPLDDLLEVGFCWALSPEPGFDDDCASLTEVPATTGDFSLDVDGLTVGTTHYVRAYSITDADEIFANEVEFTTQSLTPVLETDSSTAAVLLSWAPVAEATGYEILADGALLTTIDDPLVDSYEDTSAPAGSLSAPQNGAASEGRTDGIRVTFDPPEATPGDSVEYVLVALFDGSQAESDPVDGFRSAPVVLNYEVMPLGDDWIDIGLDTAFLDEDAPLAPVTPGAVTASKGEFPGHVRVQNGGPTIGTAPARSYIVRARISPTETTAETPEFEGRRATSASFSRQWYRTNGPDDDPTDYEPLPGATTATFNDESAPASGSIRHYRVEISIAGGETTLSDSDFGFRAHPGSVGNLSATNVTATSADLSATVTNDGAPLASDHGFTYSLSPNPVFPADASSTVVNFFEYEGNTALSTTIEGLPSETTVYVRAFMHNFAGTNYSDEFSFTTEALPEPPDFTATGSPSAVDLSWTPVDGAQGYRIWRNAGIVTTTDSGDDDSFSDSAAQAPQTNLSGLTVEQVNDTAVLSANPITGSDGSIATYEVAAINDAGQPSANRAEAQGARTWEPPTAWWEFHDGDDDWQTLQTVDPDDPGTVDPAPPTDGTTRSYRLRSQIGDATDTLTTSSVLDFTYEP